MTDKLRDELGGSDTELGERTRQALHQAEQLGLIRRTGGLRNGQPVFVATELGRRLSIPPDDEQTPQ